MLDKSVCHFRGVGSVLSLLFYVCWKILLANNVDPDQTSESDLGLHCLPMAPKRVSGKNGLNKEIGLGIWYEYGTVCPTDLLSAIFLTLFQ